IRSLSPTLPRSPSRWQSSPPVWRGYHRFTPTTVLTGWCRSGEFRQPAFEEASFGAVVGELPGPSIRLPRLVGPPETAQEFGPGRVQVAEVIEAELVHD